MKDRDFIIMLAYEIADFINDQKKQYGDLVDLGGPFGGGLTLTDFYKHLAKKINSEDKKIG